MIIHSFDILSFVTDYWQQKPCVIKNFVPNFEDPLDEHDLASFAMEDHVESRIIRSIDGKWQSNNGPFDSFEAHCIGDWTLLVQGVDRLVAQVEAISDLIRFVPKWRMDDVMISFSTQNAGVGPHIDEYDVFIIQGKGSRRWQVGLPGHYDTIIPCEGLKQIESFTPCIDEILTAGDAVYIPPKHPHNGVALEPCLNYSIGFRSPSDVELLYQLGEYDVYSNQARPRYQNPSRPQHNFKLASASQFQYEIDDVEINALKTSLIDLIKTEQTNEALMRIVSKQHLDAFPLDSKDQINPQDIRELKRLDARIERLLGLKPLFSTDTKHDGDSFIFYLDGEQYSVDSRLQARTIHLLTHSFCSVSELLADLDAQQNESMSALLCQLINDGYWLLDE